MDTQAYAIGGDDFRLDRYRHQEFWSWKIAFAFFFGDVGGGLFLFSAFDGACKCEELACCVVDTPLCELSARMGFSSLE